MGTITAVLLIAVGIYIILVPMIAQKQTDDVQKKLDLEYEKIVKKNRQSEKIEEPEPQQQIDDPVVDFTEEDTKESKENKETNEEVTAILERQQILGKITCEKIGIEYVVVEGAERDNIRASIGHILGTAQMGGEGNCVLAGHRGGYYGEFFKNIHLLQNKDKVVVTDVYDRAYVYEVYDKFVVEPTEIWVCNKIEGENTLTLLSCEDEGTRRFIVRCRLTESETQLE